MFFFTMENNGTKTLVGNNIQNIIYCVSQKKEGHTGQERHAGSKL